MKIKSIGISHMHQIQDTVTYNLNDVTYFIGQNGAGKSTILQAIQLALLGYIPGYDKTNAGILKHSSNGNELSVTITFDNDTSFTRMWKREKSTIKSSIAAVPADFTPDSLIGEIEIPIFNFSEFKSMTANKLKEWFISFLPKEGFEIDWREYLTGELGSRAALLPEGYLDEVLSYISTDLADLKGVDLVKALNAHFKEEQSFQKAQLDRLQSTLNSMIYYADIEQTDSSELLAEHRKISELRDDLIKYESQQKSIAEVEAKLSQLHLAADSVEADPEYKSAHTTRAALELQLSELTQELASANAEYTRIQSEYGKLNVTSDICPYTKTRCEKISASLDAAKQERDRLMCELNAVGTQRDEKTQRINQIKSKIADCRMIETRLERDYSNFATLCLLLPIDVIEIPTSKSVEQLQGELDEISDNIAKIKANEKFNQLNETITKDKYRAENILEVLKIWINSTGANGLQTYMMDKPFKTFADDMSKYLSSMFGTSSVASFHLEEKANSFSFGMMQKESYVEFDLLSSGEKCLFTIAMMMCLIDRSSASLKLILADDILDHLDEENASRLFSNLSTITDMQFIMAGVKECSNAGICVKIGE